MPSSRLILCCPLLLLPPIPPSIRVFFNESALRIRWPKYWSFSFSIIPSKEIPGLISFRMDWLDLLAVQGSLKESSPTPQFKCINSSVLSLLHSPTLTSIHDHRKNHSLAILKFYYNVSRYRVFLMGRLWHCLNSLMFSLSSFILWNLSPFTSNISSPQFGFSFTS